jgi:hypothetical protein
VTTLSVSPYTENATAATAALRTAVEAHEKAGVA